MFNVNEIYESDRRVVKYDSITYSPAQTCTINTPNSQIYINMNRGGSFFSLLTNYLDLNFEVIKRADAFRYANDNDIQLVKLAHTALFCIYKLTTSSGKQLN